MGAELKCKARYGKRAGEGRVLLETSEIIFRGDFRLKIPFKEMHNISAKDGVLRVSWSGETAEFEIGAAAEKWLAKIKNPKSVIEKIGIKPGMRVTLVGVKDASFARDAARIAECTNRLGKVCEAIFHGVESLAELKRVPELARALAPDGALWIIYPKGRKDIREIDVINTGRAAKLKDVKVVGFSPTHTALKFVIPLVDR
jgi:hypothetical protein